MTNWLFITKGNQSPLPSRKDFPPPLNRSTEQFGPEPFRQTQGPERQAEGLTTKFPLTVGREIKGPGPFPRAPSAHGGRGGTWPWRPAGRSYNFRIKDERRTLNVESLTSNEEQTSI
jgi:hypothetical protein